MSKGQAGNVGEEILGTEAYQPTEAEREILACLAQGEQEIARGEGHDLRDVLDEADSLLLHPPD